MNEKEKKKIVPLFCRQAEISRLEEYERQLEEIKSKVEKRPLLFERETQVSEKLQQKLHVYIYQSFRVFGTDGVRYKTPGINSGSH